jgi:hypothetical protein
MAHDFEAAADDVRPQLVAASLIAAFDAFDRPALGAVPPEDVATRIDPVFAFLRTCPSREQTATHLCRVRTCESGSAACRLLHETRRRGAVSSARVRQERSLRQQDPR